MIITVIKTQTYIRLIEYHLKRGDIMDKKFLFISGVSFYLVISMFAAASPISEYTPLYNFRME